MAETKNTATETAGNSAEKFNITLKQPLEFDDVEQQQLITSREFCSRYVNPLFKQVYADYMGSTFDVDQRGVYSISLYFDRRDHGDSVTATTRVPQSNDGMVNETVNETRRYVNRAIHGDKFYMTKKGEEGIEKFLFSNTFKRTRNGVKPDWDRVKFTRSQSGANPHTQPGSQMTVISFIDPVKIVETIFGTGTEEDRIEYDVIIRRSILNPGFVQMGATSSNYLLSIVRLRSKPVNELAAELGIVGSGLDIIRS